MTDRLTLNEGESLTTELATLSQAGLPLDSALRAAADELGRSRVANVMREMAGQVERGQSLADIVAERRDRLPRFLGAVLEAAVRSQRLDIVLPALVEQDEFQRDQSRRLRGALGYPLVILLVMAALYVTAALTIIPELLDGLAEFEVKFTAQMQFMFWWGKYGVYGLLAALPVLALLAGVTRLAVGAANWQWALTRLPVIGPAWHWAATARMAHHLALLLQLGERLPEALRLTALGVGDANVAAACGRLADDVEQGISLTAALASNGRLPQVLTPLVYAGEQSATLPESLRAAATLLDQWVVIRSSLLRQILPPIVFVFVAVGVLSLFSTVMLPMVQLINNLRW